MLTDSPKLSHADCRVRQHLLTEALRSAELDAVLLLDPAHVNYLTGHLPPYKFAAAALVSADGYTRIVHAAGLGNPPCADKIEAYEATRLGTLTDDPLDLAVKSLLSGDRPAKLACDFLPDQFHLHDARPILRRLRRFKHEDELAMIRYAIRACEAGYARARDLIAPGVTEIDLFAEILAEGTKSAGEPLGPMGNDFQAGTPGGPPRCRAMERGELIPLDLCMNYRGYHADMCRTFVVGADLSPRQHDARQYVLDALQHVELHVRPGVSCRQIDGDVRSLLTRFDDLPFPHHLGHGIGLSAHETPRLNPHWDDVFEIGDVFAVEPALYTPELRGGMRIEQIYRVTPNGVERLTSIGTEC